MNHIRKMSLTEKLNSTMNGKRVAILTDDGTRIEATLEVDPLEDGYHWQLSGVEVREIGPRLSNTDAATNPNWQISRFNSSLSRFDSTLSLKIGETTDNLSNLGQIIEVDLVEDGYPNLPAGIQQHAVELQALGLSPQQAFIGALTMANQDPTEITEVLGIDMPTVRMENSRIKEKYIMSGREIEHLQRLRDRLRTAYDIDGNQHRNQ